MRTALVIFLVVSVLTWAGASVSCCNSKKWAAMGVGLAITAWAAICLGAVWGGLI